MKTAFTLLLFTSLSLAQNAAQSDGFKKIDRNGDGKVTRDEMPKLFDQIDADKDGIASAAELTAYFAKAINPAQRKTIKQHTKLSLN
jgi:Ca2+-binding EF-hand superfamily protein